MFVVHVTGRKIRSAILAILTTARIPISVAPARNTGSHRADIAGLTVGVCHTSTVPLCFRPIRQPEAGQRHAGKAESEFLQRRAARDGLGHVLCEFIEWVVHTFSFVCELFVLKRDFG